MGAYNATVYHEDGAGQVLGVFVAEAALCDGEWIIHRSNAVQCTGLEGSLAYHNYLCRTRLHDGERFRVVKDDCRGYRQALSDLMLPPAYLRERRATP